jgi:polysaccharide deacetylase 2 family uncharacterized protein YibQ
MIKRKKTVTPKNDVKTAAIVLGLFAVAIVSFFIFSKPKVPHKQQVPAANKIIEVPAPVENVKPVGSIPVSTPVTVEPLEGIPGSGGKIAIIIDDWGQSIANCKYLKDIREPLAVSILPGLRHTKDVAKCAGLYHKLAMLHLPLEALHNYDFYPQDYIIKTTMKPDLASKIVDEDLAQLPSIEGVNNHMGSKATGDRALMRLIFNKIKKKGLFFVDSMTAHNSVCSGLADEMGLAFGKRDVFLDNINTREAITKQIVILAQKARHKGYAVAIGHDRHLTMQVIKDEIPWLEKQGFQIVSIKELLRNR